MARPLNLGPPRFLATFALWWLLFASLGVLWSLATPLGASPDAPSQVARAASVARGQWLGPAVPGNSSAITTYVKVPGTYLDPGLLPHCYMFKEATTAACAPPAGQSARLVQTETHVGRYPPLYYALVGWPSLLTNGVDGIYFMEAASALLCGAMLALAMAVVRRWSSSPLLVPAVAVAATPMSLFLASQVNPSGLEIAAAISVWASAAVLVREHLEPFDRLPPGLLAALAFSTAVLVWTRPTALLWPFVVALVLLPVAIGRLRARLLLGRELLISSFIVLLVAFGALAWALLAHATAIGPNFGPLPATSSLGHVFSFVFGRLPSLVQQGVGNFGWLDTPLPWYVVAVWLLLAGALLATAAIYGDMRAVSSGALAVIMSVLVPVGLLVGAARSYGYVGQGRYFLAVWVGIPLVAGGALAYRGRGGHWATPARVPRLLAPALGLVVIVGQAFSYYWALRRYIVGIPGPLAWTGSKGARTPAKQLEWQPPVPGWWLLGIFVALCALYWVAICRSAALQTRHQEGDFGRTRAPQPTEAPNYKGRMVSA